MTFDLKSKRQGRQIIKGEDMYQDLKRKLELYKESHASRVNHVRREGCDINDIIDGTILENDDGTCFIIENRYPLTYLHGGYALGDLLDISLNSMSKVCKDLRLPIYVPDFLFLDTETTGLSGGTGTVAFLIGTGFFTEDSFVLRQYFMRDYDEEPAMLRGFNELLSGFKGLVTFNGKAFDWNLLTTRYISNRMKPVLSSPMHIDLLFPSRRIWKLKLDSCRLASLEENILCESRVDDIPGALIPSAYFEYLESRDASEIKKVIKHNETDILSMVSLLIKISQMLDDPLSEADSEEELLGIGRIFEESGEHKIVTRCFELCMESGDSTIKQMASKRLSRIYKRNDDYDKAVLHWEKMLEESMTSNIFPLIELAKYYEHKEKNYLKAIEMVKKAINLSQKVGFSNNIHYPELKKRMDRLQRKLLRSTGLS